MARTGEFAAAVDAGAVAVRCAGSHLATVRIAAEAAALAAAGTPAERAAEAEGYAARAVEWIGRLARGDAAAARSLLDDPRFTFLRTRADAARLVKEVGRR